MGHWDHLWGLGEPGPEPTDLEGGALDRVSRGDARAVLAALVAAAYPALRLARVSPSNLLKQAVDAN